MPSVMNEIVSPNEIADVEEKVDEQTFELMVKIYRELDRRLQLSANEAEALRRLVDTVARPNLPKDHHRNNIFKAANALGLKLPSHFF